MNPDLTLSRHSLFPEPPLLTFLADALTALVVAAGTFWRGLDLVLGTAQAVLPEMRLLAAPVFVGFRGRRPDAVGGV